VLVGDGVLGCVVLLVGVCELTRVYVGLDVITRYEIEVLVGLGLFVYCLSGLWFAWMVLMLVVGGGMVLFVGGVFFGWVWCSLGCFFSLVFVGVVSLGCVFGALCCFVWLVLCGFVLGDLVMVVVVVVFLVGGCGGLGFFVC